MRGRKPLRDKSLAVSITGGQFPKMPKCRLQSIIRKEHGGYSLLSINYIKYVEKKQVERKKYHDKRMNVPSHFLLLFVFLN